MESRQPTPINGRLNQQYRREAVIRSVAQVCWVPPPAEVTKPHQCFALRISGITAIDATIQRDTDWLRSDPDRWKEQNANRARDHIRRFRTIGRCSLQILREIKRLDTHNNRITGCRVKVIAPSNKRRHGTGFQVHIWLTIPPHENIVANESGPNDARHEHAQVAIKDAFAAARRQVDALAR
jgi:hypothetical protein